jgi:ethanolamine utilization protein EutA
VRLEDSGKAIAQEIGRPIDLGDLLTQETEESMCSAMAIALCDAIQGVQTTKLTRMLMLTPSLPFTGRVDELTFSGGVAEYIYNTTSEDYNDLGITLAREVLSVVKRLPMRVVMPEQRIRATVIGAGMFNLQVSGSTTFLTAGIKYPLRNLVAVVPDVPKGRTLSDDVKKAVQKAFQRFDLVEGTDDVILAFNDAVRPSYENLIQFAEGVLAALPNTISSGRPILMCFDTDVGNSVGNVMRRETRVANNILSIDEISLRDGDFLDIGEPIIEGVVVPVVVKTLVFEH